MKEIRAAILGFGGIAASHKVAYDVLAKRGCAIRLVAICEKSGRFESRDVVTNLGTVNTGSLEGLGLYTSFERMLEKEDIDVIDICLPTPLHKDFTIKALAAGKHVMCEKPMSLDYGDCLEMVSAAEEVGKRLMIGQCLRFDPCYLYLKDLVRSEKYGRARRVFMSRLTALPRWSSENIYKQIAKTGGCTFDLHIHDVDMMRFIFGEPSSLSAVEYLLESGHQYVSTRMLYPGMLAELQASFDESATTPFEMGYRVRFDGATVIFENGTVTVYPDEGEPYHPDIDDTDRIENEISYFAECVINGKNEINPARGSAESIRLAGLISESAQGGGRVIEL